MKKLKIFSFLTVLSLGLVFCAYKKGEKNETTIHIMMSALHEVHLAPQAVDDKLSEKVFDLYIKRLDYSKKFLLKGDVDMLSKKYRHDIDDEINRGTFEFFDESDKLSEDRIKEAEAYYKEFLGKPFDFTKNETVETDYKKLNFVSTKNELKEEWRKSLKEQVLSRLSGQMDIQEKAKDQKDTSVKIKTFAELEEDARKKTLKTHDDWFKRMSQYDKAERFGSYLNCIANTYDPHTEFFPPKEKEEFDVQMTGQFEGIGASLMEKDGFIKVDNIVAGSASYRQGQLKAGDIILKVAQGKDEPVDVANMRFDKVVSMIRGKKGTEVRLTVKKPDASIVIISIIRDKVIIEGTFAHSFILNEKDKKVGYILLPGFYFDANRKGGHNCSDDMRKEVLKLKAEKVDGIVIDLRNNGGGSLEEVVKMSGLFIDKGPMVQVRGKGNFNRVLNDNESGTIYDGPLAIMVNTNSASASEILAAAMQDYKRAIIVGGKSTFGKGTVQNFFNLDDALSGNDESMKPLGQVKITLEKFYRISGGSTQLKGVIPDLILPDPYSELETGEKDQEYPMPYDEIQPATYTTTNSFNLATVLQKSNKRTAKSPTFNLIREQAVRVKSQKDKSEVNLNLEAYRKEQKMKKEENKKFESIATTIPGLDISPTKREESENVGDTTYIAQDRERIKLLKKDNYLYETMQVVEDMKQ